MCDGGMWFVQIQEMKVNDGKAEERCVEESLDAWDMFSEGDF
jgi:hypothetical protein